jgi:plastocyanin
VPDCTSILRTILLITAVFALLAQRLPVSGADAIVPAYKPPAVVEGVIHYDPDPKRPWRYSRYYVANRKTGELAEAVVCLSGKSLSGLAPREKREEATIDQKDYRFTPETIAIRAGDAVRFTNSDTSIHNVMTGDGIDPFNVNIQKDDSHTQTFRRAGGIKRPIRLGCAYHSTMQAWIFVFDHPYYAVTEADGKFRFENVPPGEYTLDVMHPSGGLLLSQKITLDAGQTLQQNVHVSPDNLTKEKP